MEQNTLVIPRKNQFEDWYMNINIVKLFLGLLSSQLKYSNNLSFFS